MAIKGQECDKNMISEKAKAQHNIRSKPRCIELNCIAFRFIFSLFQNIIITMSRFGDRDRGFGGGRDRDRDRDGGSRFGGGGRFGGGFGGK